MTFFNLKANIQLAPDSHRQYLLNDIQNSVSKYLSKRLMDFEKIAIRYKLYFLITLGLLIITNVGWGIIFYFFK